MIIRPDLRCVAALVAVALFVGLAAAPSRGADDGRTGQTAISAEEAAFIAAHGKVRLGVSANYAPYDYLGRDGGHRGIAAAYAQIIGQRLGIAFEPVAAATMSDGLQNLERGSVDVLAAVGRTPERDGRMLFSQPYLSGPWAIVTRAEASAVLKLSDLSDQSVSVVLTQPIRQHLRAHHRRVRLVDAKDAREALERVDAGDAYAAIVSILVAGELIQGDYLGRLKVASTLPDVVHEVRFAVRPDWPLLASAIDRTLAAMPEEEHRQIRALGLARDTPPAIDWRRLTIIGGPILAALTAIMVAALLANRGMRREIARRRALEKALVDNEDRLRTILRSAPEGVVTVDHGGRITYWNPAAEKIFGYTEAEALGREVHQLLSPPEALATAQAGLSAFAAHGRGAALNRVVEFDATHKSGRNVPVDMARAAYRKDGEWHAVAFVRDTTERRIAENEVLEAKAAAESSRRRLLDMSDALPCAVYQIRVGADGGRRYTFVSKNVADVLGVDLDTLRANEEARWRHVHEDDIASLRATVDEVARSGERLFCEYRVRLGDALKWIRQEALRQTQTDGSVVWNGYWLDVTEIKRAEATLSDQLIFQRLLLDSLPNAVFFKGADGRFLGCNRACEQMFGIPSSELVGRTAQELEIFPPEARGSYHEADLALIRSRGTRHLQTRMRFADGADHEVLYWATGFALSDGRPGGMIGVVVDISEQKRAEELLKETEQWYRSILETAPDGLLVADAAGRITLVNAQTERLFGYRREEILGQPVEALVPERLRPAHRQHRNRYLDSATTRQMGSGAELYAVHKDGREFPVEVGLSPLPRRAGEPPAVSASIRDITARKRADDALREAMKRAEDATQAKSMFLANMSHEIRTPMNAIIGMAHLALGTQLTVRQRDYLSKIHEASISLLSIINDILDFSKIEAGRMDLERVDFSLEDVLANVSLVVEQRAAEKGLEVLIHPPLAIPAVLTGDPLRLGQILTNLVNNSVKFTEQGEIEVSAAVEERSDRELLLHFAVRDSGVGMSEEQVERLFRPFTQADGSTTRRYGGTGLGLTICKRLVELMDGRIWAESRLGEGSTFHFTVRLGVGAERNDSGRTVPPSLDKLRVLVVDDHPAARDILAENLSSLPVRVATADSARSALAQLRAADDGDPYRVVFMDWKMPEIDGAEATRMVKTAVGLRHVPKVIVVTAFARDEARGRAEEAGADGFLVKPIGRSMLVDTLVEAVEPARRLPVPPKPPAASAQLSGMRVLLVEDNAVNQQIASELLHAAGATVEVANNGREALDRLDEPADRGPIHAVLMDLQMPVMDGIEATRTIRSRPGLAELPVIAMTAHALLEEREQCIAAGMSDHLPKPIDPEELIATLRRWWERDDGGRIAALRGIAGLDASDGLRRVAGARDLYVSLLRQFVRDHGDSPQRIAEALERGERRLAEHLAHTVKGVAGNIGARRVQAAAQVLERALRDNAGPGTIDTARDEYAAAAGALLAALERRLPPAQSAAEEGGDAQAQLRRLADLLAQYEGEAVELFDARRELIRQAMDPAIFARIDRALRGYRFDEALAALRAALPAETTDQP